MSSSKRVGRHTPRGRPIMDVIDVPNDLPAPTTTRPLLSRIETLARSRATSSTRSNSRASSVSSAAASARSRKSYSGKMMEGSSFTKVKREDSNNNSANYAGTSLATTSTNISALEVEREQRYVPSSESPEPMNFRDSNSDQMVVDEEEQEAQESASASQGGKRKRTPDDGLEAASSTTLVHEEQTQNPPSARSSQQDLLEAELRDGLDSIATPESLTNPHGTLLRQISSGFVPIHQPDGHESGQSSPSLTSDHEFVGMSTIRQPDRLQERDDSPVDRDDRMRVEMLLNEDHSPGPLPNSSSRQVPRIERSMESSEFPSPPLSRDKGKTRARTESERPPAHQGSSEVIDISDSPPTPYRPLPPGRTHFGDKGKQKAETMDVSAMDEEIQLEGAKDADDTNAGDEVDTCAPEPATDQNPEDDSHLSAYTCPICFGAPTNATLTPCGHICCGECLFTAIKTTQQRVAVIGQMEDARCPVCRAVIPGWDGKGGGVFGLKIRAVFSM